MEASLFSAQPSSCLGQFVQASVHHSLHCLDNTGCEADRSVGGDDPAGLPAFFQWENVRPLWIKGSQKAVE